MKISKLLLVAGSASLMGLATPAPANATFWCWFGKCGGSSSGGTSSTGGNGSTGGNTSTGGNSSSGGTPTPVPEPEQMALFGMGAAVLAGRMFLAGRKRK